MPNRNFLKEQTPLYVPEKAKEHLVLTDEQKNAVRAITMGLEEVDERVRSMTVDDVVTTIENGHPLNRLMTGPDGAVNGFVACEDFVPREAYIKYLGTTKSTGRNLLQEIPAFLEYAKQQGYSKINFHGWNERINHILERYGFQRLRTDSAAGFNVDFYEKSLGEEKSAQDISQERLQAFEQKYLQKLQQEYQQTLKTFSSETRSGKEQSILETYEVLARRLQGKTDFNFTERQQAVLKLKLARYFQNNESCDTNTLYDAIVESPKFIDTDKGSLHRLFEVHEIKTLEKIAEIRKERAEIKDGDKPINPYEALFPTSSGKYYMARLLNMPHLEEESGYMNHCVGTSDSYVNKIKRGEVEILSFRHAPRVNPETQKLEGDEPILTIEYNLKTREIEQIKKSDDRLLKPGDMWLPDFIEALKQLRITKTDAGEQRDFLKIAPSELADMPVSDYCVLTDHGEVNFRYFNPEGNDFVLNVGEMAINPGMTKVDAVKIIRIVEGIICQPDELAFSETEITAATKVYIGPLFYSLFQKDIDYLYTSFPENKIHRENIEIGGKTAEQLIAEMEAAHINIPDYAKSIMENRDFIPGKNREEATLIRLTVADLGFKINATTDQIYERAQALGLELCPPDTGPNYRLKYKDQPLNEWVRIGMKPIAFSDSYPKVFQVVRDYDGLWLHGDWTGSLLESPVQFVFRLPKKDKNKN